MDKFNIAIKIESATRPAEILMPKAASDKHVEFKTCTETAVQVLKIPDYKAAAACLASAFERDPACTYFLNCPDTVTWSAEEKWALHLQTFECAVYAHILNGLAVGIPSSSPGGGFDAVALWMGPGRNMDDWLTILRSGFWRLQLWGFSPEGKERFFNEFLPLLHETKTQVLAERDEKSWYLVYIGTREEARGKGLARRLIRAGTEQADAAGMPCYLESSHEANVPFYQRLGFEVQKTIQLQKGDRASLAIMVRESGTGTI